MKEPKLTYQQKVDIAMDMIRSNPIETVGNVAMIKVAELGVNSDCKEISFSTDALINGQNYKCKMVVTWEEKN